jgi:hypothetical protein
LVAWNAADGVSVLWRSGALVGQLRSWATHGITELDGSMRAGMHGFALNRFRPRVLSMNTHSRAVLLHWAGRVSRFVVPTSAASGKLMAAHSSAATVSAAVSGHLPAQELFGFAPEVPAKPSPGVNPTPLPIPRPMPAPQSAITENGDLGGSQSPS